MGKRTSSENNSQPSSPTKRRKRLPRNKQPDDQHASSSDENSANIDKRNGCTPSKAAADQVLNNSVDNSPKPEYVLSRDLVNGTILTDVKQKEWRIGNPIGKGSFGEIFLASDNTSKPVTSENAKYVVKIEPHSNGPLFVEIHCLLNTAKNTEDDPLPPGMPEFIAFGSHVFRETRYRFLILQRFDRDLHSLIKRRRVDQKSVLTLAVQIIDILEHIHSKGYCHSDIKAENLMIGKCTYNKDEKNKENNTSVEPESGRRSGARKKATEESEESSEYSSESSDDEIYKTPVQNKRVKVIPYSGSNPVRSCRFQNRTNAIYEEMVNSHYLRPTKRVSYTSYFEEDNRISEEETLDQFILRSMKKATLNKDTAVTETRIFLIDFGLASKFMDSNGVHRPFFMDQRRAHDGTLEFTSRDAHLGAHSRRSDLECFGYNLIFWSQGYLPWKENAAQLQHEKVHWMKEYFMTDVKEMLKQIYGKTVPKYLGEFMHYVGNLAYSDQPDYEKCKNIFKREYEKLGYDVSTMALNVSEIVQNAVEVKDELENNNTCGMKHIKSIMKNLGVVLPFRETPSSTRISPKNLRSKSECKNSSVKKKKFSWTEILSQDPDQIARERAEKEFDREPTTETPLIRYTGKPTYAILEIEKRLKFKDRLDAVAEEPEQEVLVEGYNKAMMKLLRKRQITLLAEAEEILRQRSADKTEESTPATTPMVKTSKNTTKTANRPKRVKKTASTPPKRNVVFAEVSDKQRQRRNCRRNLSKPSSSGTEFTTTDESSCSSVDSVEISSQNMIRSRNSCKTSIQPNGTTRATRRGTSSSCSNFSSSGVSEEDSPDDLPPVFSPKKTRHTLGKLKLKIVKNATNGNLNVSAICVDDGDENDCDDGVDVEEQHVVGARRRKRSIPKKRNNSTKVLKTMKQSVRGRPRGNKHGQKAACNFSHRIIVIQDDENRIDDEDESDDSSVIGSCVGGRYDDVDSSDFDFIPDDGGSDYEADYMRVSKRLKKRICRG